MGPKLDNDGKKLSKAAQKKLEKMRKDDLRNSDSSMSDSEGSDQEGRKGALHNDAEAGHERGFQSFVT